MPRRASLPEGKSLFFRRSAESDESESPASTAVVPEPLGDRPREATVERDESSDRGAAPSPASSTRQSAIFLEERHLDWLEDKCREARQHGGRAIRKALLIRALLDVAMESPVDLTALRKDEDLVDRVRRGLRGS